MYYQQSISINHTFSEKKIDEKEIVYIEKLYIYKGKVIMNPQKSFIYDQMYGGVKSVQQVTKKVSFIHNLDE